MRTYAHNCKAVALASNISLAQSQSCTGDGNVCMVIPGRCLMAYCAFASCVDAALALPGVWGLVGRASPGMQRAELRGNAS